MRDTTTVATFEPEGLLHAHHHDDRQDDDGTQGNGVEPRLWRTQRLTVGHGRANSQAARGAACSNSCKSQT